MSDNIEALRLRISGLERELTRINSHASAAVVDRQRMQTWFSRERPNLIGHSPTVLDLVRIEQAALDEFAQVSRQLANARRELDAQFEQSLSL
jgi:hypothetical protein